MDSVNNVPEGLSLLLFGLSRTLGCALEFKHSLDSLGTLSKDTLELDSRLEVREEARGTSSESRRSKYPESSLRDSLFNDRLID